ncbi:hypothetical protein KGA66_19000 [Actinocrinis puniceicyclus]|uniref:Pyruvate carboxyltransferase domain-containing protein n=1 Tax=Actinocrinis puniceicyclus TaxID=977794 RepID=A0A8J7WSE9_9ACTN|nr:hypothetical protein [Actinocrinis puniceicyclus]MBS2965147.1 hypothetical protein [Actinocrinis puniceicyclus]
MRESTLGAKRPTTLLDVTLRDGGYVNGHAWTVQEASDVVGTMEAAGIPFVEVGYLRTASGESLNPSKRCEPAYLEALATGIDRTRLVVMARPSDGGPQLIRGLARRGVGMLRVLAASLNVESAASHIAAGREEGLCVAVNLTHVSRFSPEQIAAAAGHAARAGAQIVYLADSNGSLYPEDVAARISAAVQAVPASPATRSQDEPVRIGFHAHDNLGLAFANARAALEAGASYLDGSLLGIGKGGGNLPIELIAGYLAVTVGSDVRLDPLMTDRVAAGARLRMLVDGGSSSLITGLLDLSLDQYGLFKEQTAHHGYDWLLRYGLQETLTP